ncbi:MAG: hypothetical protein ACREEY_11480, partial [Brevundimonas sp.]
TQIGLFAHGGGFAGFLGVGPGVGHRRLLCRNNAKQRGYGSPKEKADGLPRRPLIRNRIVSYFPNSLFQRRFSRLFQAPR